MRKHICYYMRENIMMLAAQSARATMLVLNDSNILNPFVGLRNFPVLQSLGKCMYWKKGKLHKILP
jgi:hypothetical protein